MERTDAIARLTSYALDRTASDFDRDALLDIADAIEREAKADRVDAYTKGYDEGFASADDWAAQHEDAMAEHGWVRLPKDADGVPIHIGDEMDTEHFGTVEVEGFVHRAVAFYNYSGQPAYLCTTPANLCRHHHAPTVEDVLREFAEGLGVPVADSYVAATAAKLRLAEEVDG